MVEEYYEQEFQRSLVFEYQSEVGVQELVQWSLEGLIEWWKWII